MLRRTLRVLAYAVAALLVMVVIQYFASESGEVVVVRTRDAAGSVHETRLWVVEHEGFAWLRAGNASGGWFTRLSAQPEIEVVRDGRTLAFRAEPVPEARDAINARMNEKYGWADSAISLVFPRSKKIPVRLVPATPTS